MSRLPRVQEHLKTGFTAEAVSAARFRAYAARARQEGLTGLAGRWEELAAAKDELAILQLEAAGQVGAPPRAVADALAEERFENDVLYPKMGRDAGGEAAAVFERVVEAQRGHLERLLSLREELQAAVADLA